MCRTAVILIALATFTVAGASGAEVSAKAHRRTPARMHVRAAHRRTTPHKVHPRVAVQTTHRAQKKLTPEEAGRAAGLAIRRELEHRRIERRNVAYRERRERAGLRYAAARTSRRRVITHAARPMDVSLMAEPQDSIASETSQGDDATSRTAEPRSDASRGASEQADVSEDAELAGTGEKTDQIKRAVAGRKEARPSHPESDTDSSLAGGAATAASTENEPADGPADAPTTDTGRETEQASLDIPRGVMPAPLRGSLASLERQNEKLEAEGLERIVDESDLEARIAEGMLVSVPVSSTLTINADLPADRRYCRPWTARFLVDLARDHSAAFHRPLEVSSAVRTVAYQRRLMETNGNAAPAEGDIVSPHLTGATVDIAKKGMSRREIGWMRRQLLALEDAGKIDVEEEFHQACFHITVYKTYAPAGKLHPGLKATSPANRPTHLPAPSAASVEAATDGL